eukprot:CAMPEP_0184660262 /NCGR_PEP_ID=MMETSP0308-20130426/33144_1 /TAXON_ID=38269 /ORGANISM="Gloeochaete witrockiana, Strain SAG 46.84" /LENGTH=43 /DNA_ID= /DNA_START= /DNA_END= /DNA_ORIENTATION=
MTGAYSGSACRGRGVGLSMPSFPLSEIMIACVPDCVVYNGCDG